MLRRAQQRVRALGLSQCRNARGDGRQESGVQGFLLRCGSGAYVITAVPDPARTLDDFIRVLKPGANSFWSITSARRRPAADL